MGMAVEMEKDYKMKWPRTWKETTVKRSSLISPSQSWMRKEEKKNSFYLEDQFLVLSHSLFHQKFCI